MAIALLTIYAFFLGFILLFSLTQLQLTWAYVKAKRKSTKSTPTLDLTKPLARVTVQLPLYNEKYVVERLIDQVAKLDWPHDRLEVQVIDDSTDETQSLAQDRVNHWCNHGMDMVLV